MAYKVMKKLIQNGRYVKSDVMSKLDVFLAVDQLTVAEYTELVELVNLSE